MSYQTRLVLAFTVVAALGCGGRTPTTTAPPETGPGDDLTEREDEVGVGTVREEPSVDLDGDGLGDDDELRWAREYLPFLSNHPEDECALSGIVFRARPHPQDPSLVSVIYSRLYERDCGLTSHLGDNEAFGITLDPAAPAPAGLVAVRAISHQSTICQRTTTCGTCPGLDDCDAVGGRAVLYASKNKHAGAVDLAQGCSTFGSCFDQCELADVDAGAGIPLVNAGEPDAPLVRDLTESGFITPENGWTEESFAHFDPWGAEDFGGAGNVGEDLVDDAFLTPACRAPGSSSSATEEFAPAADADVDGPLCTVPPSVDDVVDPVNIECTVEVNNHLAPAAPATSSLHVVTWNLRFGEKHDDVLSAFVDVPELAGADVLLLSEVARRDGESVPAGVEQAKEIGALMGMNYAFAVEWNRTFDDAVPEPRGEHGVAVFARYPIGNLEVIRHTPAHDFWDGEQRLGGRVTLGATVRVPTAAGDVDVRVYSSHLCTRPLFPDDDGRAIQGREIRADAERPGRPAMQIVGGDLNTWTCNPAASDCTQAPAAELVVQEFRDDDAWLDGTDGYNGRTQLGEGFFPQRLDWLFYRRLTATPGTALVDVGASDHFPLYMDVELSGAGP